MTEDARRFLNNAARTPNWTAIVTATDIDDIFNACGGTVFCNGMLREVTVQPITEKTIKISTKSIN